MRLRILYIGTAYCSLLNASVPFARPATVRLSRFSVSEFSRLYCFVYLGFVVLFICLHCFVFYFFVYLDWLALLFCMSDISVLGVRLSRVCWLSCFVYPFFDVLLCLYLFCLFYFFVYLDFLALLFCMSEFSFLCFHLSGFYGFIVLCIWVLWFYLFVYFVLWFSSLYIWIDWLYCFVCLFFGFRCSPISFLFVFLFRVSAFLIYFLSVWVSFDLFLCLSGFLGFVVLHIRFFGFMFSSILVCLLYCFVFMT